MQEIKNVMSIEWIILRFLIFINDNQNLKNDWQQATLHTQIQIYKRWNEQNNSKAMKNYFYWSGVRRTPQCN